MPGFTVNKLGSGPSSNVKPFYSYTWQIISLFEDQIDDSSPLIFVRDCTTPTFNAKRDEINGASLVYKYAEEIVWDDVHITFYDIPVGGKKIADYLRRWRTSIWMPEFGILPASEYQKQSKIDILNVDGSIKRTWTLYNSWPQTIKDGDLTYTESNIKIVEVVLSYDWADDSEPEEKEKEHAATASSGTQYSDESNQLSPSTWTDYSDYAM